MAKGYVAPRANERPQIFLAGGRCELPRKPTDPKFRTNLAMQWVCPPYIEGRQPPETSGRKRAKFSSEGREYEFLRKPTDQKFGVQSLLKVFSKSSQSLLRVFSGLLRVFSESSQVFSEDGEVGAATSPAK